MFTPPPSPLPLPRIIVTDESRSDTEPKSTSAFTLSELSPSGSVDQDEKRMQEAQAALTESIIRSHERRRRSGRRMRWAVLLIPALLILVALTSRRVSTFAVFIPQELVFDSLLDEVSQDGTIWEAHDSLRNVESDLRVEATKRSRDQMHHRKRQILSLTNPVALSSFNLITSTITSDLPSSTSNSPSTTISQTQQTIPPVPDSSNPPALPTPFPQPYDSIGTSSNISTLSCVNFFTNMTQTSAFRSCRPFSLLEQFSSEFIEAQTNLTLLNTLIFGTCNTSLPLSTCTSNMDWFASELTDACSSELKQDNEMATQTLLGLKSYRLLRSAACLTNQQSNTYCYANAAHASSPADFYLYQLPLGVGFPVSTTQPSCSSCARSMLSLYADALRNGNGSEGGLKDTYEDAASQAESVCGSGYALVGLATSSALGRSGEVYAGMVMVLGVLTSVLMWS